jgi:hypothetical protein
LVIVILYCPPPFHGFDSIKPLPSAVLIHISKQTVLLPIVLSAVQALSLFEVDPAIDI